MDVGAEEVDVLAGLFRGLAQRTRLATLLGVWNERSFREIADVLGVTPNAVTQQFAELEELQLTYRVEDAAYPYRLTALGTFFAVFVEQHREALLAALDVVEDAEQQARDEFQDVPMSEDRIEEEVRRRKWELVGDELYDLLDEIGDRP